MSFFKKRSIPCIKTKTCPFEYNGATPRDIEGMPFAKNEKDERICPKFGHLCPQYLEELGLSIEDLNIRATIHCGFTANEMLGSGKWKLEEMGETAKQVEDLLVRYKRVLEQYPQGKFPKYYIWEA